MHQSKTCELCGIESKRLSKHKLFCEDRVEFMKLYELSLNILQIEYDNLGSVLEFVKKYPFKNRSIEFFYKVFKFYNVNYSIKKSTNHKNVRNKYKETCLKNHGVEHNFSKNSESRKNWEKRLFEEEGITNVFQREDVKLKSLETIITKYESKSNASRIKSSGNNQSYLNNWLFKILKDSNVLYDAEFMIRSTNKDKYFFKYDARLGNKLIEINGDYWHGNPKFYKANDLILRGTSKEMKVSEKWEYDLKKEDFAKSMGFQVLTIWENEVKTSEQSTIERILNYAKN